MSAPSSTFDYAIVRVVPRPEREEFVNVGVIVSCHARRSLVARIELDEARLLALAPDVDLDTVRRHLEAIVRVAAGGAAAGPLGALSARERWHWLVSPRSALIQVSAPHPGLGDAPDAVLERLMNRFVRTGQNQDGG